MPESAGLTSLRHWEVHKTCSFVLSFKFYRFWMAANVGGLNVLDTHHSGSNKYTCEVLPPPPPPTPPHPFIFHIMKNSPWLYPSPFNSSLSQVARLAEELATLLPIWQSASDRDMVCGHRLPLQKAWDSCGFLVWRWVGKVRDCRGQAMLGTKANCYTCISASSSMTGGCHRVTCLGIVKMFFF